MFKRIVSAVLATLLLWCFCITTFANSISPRYMYTASIRSDLTISSNTATCISEVKGYLGETTKIVIEQTLEKEISPNNWDEIDSWTKTVNSYRSSFTNTKSGLESGTYRVITIAKVYVGENFEQTTTYSVVKTA